jgi:hypothetical protein
MAKQAKREIKRGAGKDAARWAAPGGTSLPTTRVQWALLRHDMRRKGAEMVKLQELMRGPLANDDYRPNEESAAQA